MTAATVHVRPFGSPAACRSAQHKRRIVMKIALAFLFTCALCGAAYATDRIARPSVPPQIEAPAGLKPILVGHAVGTQNFICAPASGGGYDWWPIGPQATLFDDAGQQIATHFHSKNPF